MSFLPGPYNFSIYRGDTFDLGPLTAYATTFNDDGTIATQTPVDMTGGSLRAQCRTGTDLTGANSTLVDTLTITNFVAASGTFSLHMDASVTAAQTWSQLSYDIEYTDGDGNVQTLMAGSIAMDPDVSRA